MCFEIKHFSKCIKGVGTKLTPRTSEICLFIFIPTSTILYRKLATVTLK